MSRRRPNGTPSSRRALEGAADLQLKDLEIYRDDAPPTDYSTELELAALDRFADSLGLDRFHLIGYSGGGFISLAYAGMYTNRLLSLALFEPARVPGEMTVAEQDFRRPAGEQAGGAPRTGLYVRLRPRAGQARR